MRKPFTEIDHSGDVGIEAHGADIREFGKAERSDAAIHLIAEIIDQFDVLAIVELRDDLSDLKRVMDLLGSYWQVVMSDYNVEGAGNRERIAYLYDSRMVRFTGLAAEADPPKEKRNGVYVSAHPDWWRSPYMASFTAGNFEFEAGAKCSLVTYGADSTARTTGHSETTTAGSPDATKVVKGGEFTNGMATFMATKFGAMVDVSVVGQKFSYTPKK